MLKFVVQSTHGHTFKNSPLVAWVLFSQSLSILCMLGVSDHISL